LEPAEESPGVYCLNDDMQANATMIKDYEDELEELVVPIWEPKAFL
jgi:hypothetical protein